MFEKNNLTDFEKLLFAIKYISELKKELKETNIENGILKSEKSELEYLLKKENPTNNKLNSYKQQIKNQNLKIEKYKKMYSECFAKLISTNQ